MSQKESIGGKCLACANDLSVLWKKKKNDFTASQIDISIFQIDKKINNLI